MPRPCGCRRRRQKHGAGAIAHFDELGIYRLLSLVPDSEELRQFVTDALGELATHDSPENADLRLTLAVLIDTNLNVAEASRLLFFHYNTLRYRIAARAHPWPHDRPTTAADAGSRPQGA